MAQANYTHSEKECLQIYYFTLSIPLSLTCLCRIHIMRKHHIANKKRGWSQSRASNSSASYSHTNLLTHIEWRRAQIKKLTFTNNLYLKRFYYLLTLIQKMARIYLRCADFSSRLCERTFKLSLPGTAYYDSWIVLAFILLPCRWAMSLKRRTTGKFQHQSLSFPFFVCISFSLLTFIFLYVLFPLILRVPR